MAQTSWGSTQEELLQQLVALGFNEVHGRTAIVTNPGRDIFHLLDWMNKNPSPYKNPTSVPTSQPTFSGDDQLRRLEKEEEDRKREMLQNLLEMGFTKEQCTLAMMKLPSAPLSRLADWLFDPKNTAPSSGKESKSKDSKNMADEPWVIVDQGRKKKKKTEIVVGSKVRVKPSVTDPTHGWGSVQLGETGVVKRMEGTSDLWIDFSKQVNWHAIKEEMELIESSDDDEEPGSQPGGGSSTTTSTSLIMALPKSDKKVLSPPPEMPKTIIIGSKVRVRKAIIAPRNGWGTVKHGDVGVVVKITPDGVYCDFDTQTGWRADLVELELAEESAKGSSSTPIIIPDSPDKKVLITDPDDLPPEFVAFERQESESAQNQFLRTMFEEDKKCGRPLTLEQHNFVLMKDHKNGDTYSCKVCYDDELTLDKILVLEECKHFLCKNCMSQHILTQTKSMNVGAIRCPEVDCLLMVAFAEVKRCIPDKDFQYFQQLLLEDSLKKDPSCRWCPKPGCGTAMIGRSENPMMRCPREECKFAFCFNCKEAWHSDATCEQYQKWKTENSEADSRYAAWAAKNTKPCPKCKVAIQKNAGCNHMKCINCRHEFCWLCMGTVVDVKGKYIAGHWALDERSPCYQKMHT